VLTCGDGYHHYYHHQAITQAQEDGDKPPPVGSSWFADPVLADAIKLVEQVGNQKK